MNPNCRLAHKIKKSQIAPRMTHLAAHMWAKTHRRECKSCYGDAINRPNRRPGSGKQKKQQPTKNFQSIFSMQSSASETFLNGGKHLLKEVKCLKLLSVFIEILSIFTFWLNSPTGRLSPLDFNSSLCPCTSKLSNCDRGEEEKGNSNNKKVFRRLVVRSPGCLLYLCLPLASYSRHV